MAPSLPCRRHVLPCLRSHASAVVPCRSVFAFAPGHDTKIVSQDNSLCAHARSCRTHCAPYRGHVPDRIMAQARCIATQSRPLSHDTKFVSRLNSLARPREHMLPHALAHSQPCRGLYRGHTTPCRGCGLTVSCPARCTSQRAPALPLSLTCQNTTCCIMTQT